MSRFILNDESVMNSYGFRIKTAGIDLKRFEANPVMLDGHNTSNLSVIGKWKDIKVEHGKLSADTEFDEDDEFAKQIAGKVERGFIRMCSLGADVIETSLDTDLIFPGQTLETVTKCKMVELSIVDIGGNDQALRLSRDGQPALLKKVNLKKQNTMSELKTIALALGLNADTDEAVVLQNVNELKNAEKETKEWKDKFMALQKSEATKLVDKAVTLGLIPEDLKDAQLLALENDFEGQSVKLNKLINEKETANAQDKRKNEVKDFVGLTKQNAGGKTTANGGNEECFDYLQKHDVVELKRIQKEEPEKYAQLFKEYKAGVRFHG